MSFSNQTIIPPKLFKPHICRREGWWRVSPMTRRGTSWWDKAHTFIHRLNRQDHPNA